MRGVAGLSARALFPSGHMIVASSGRLVLHPVGLLITRCSSPVARARHLPCAFWRFAPAACRRSSSAGAVGAVPRLYSRRHDWPLLGDGLASAVLRGQLWRSYIFQSYWTSSRRRARAHGSLAIEEQFYVVGLCSSLPSQAGSPSALHWAVRDHRVLTRRRPSHGVAAHSGSPTRGY